MKELKFKPFITPIISNTIKHEFIEHCHLIQYSTNSLGVSGELYCTIDPISNINNFINVVNVITNEKIQLNLNYVILIKPLNITKITFEHKNENYGNLVTVYFSHNPDTKIEMVENTKERRIEDLISMYNIKQIYFMHIIL